MKAMLSTHILFLLVITAAFTVSAQPGSLDTTFGTGGKVTTVIGTNGGTIFGITIQTDGKIVTAGSIATSSSANVELARYNSDGTLDSLFDTDGLVTTVVGSGSSAANAVAIQPDGKIVIGGSYYVSNSDFLIARYNTDGSLDTTFSIDGVQVTDVGGANEYCQSVAIQPDGKIVALGRTGTFPNFDFLTIRYNTDGTVDTTFDTDGIVQTAVGAGDDRGYSIGLQPDGKIVVGGASAIGSDYQFSLARYNTDGSLDSSFDSDGLATMGIATYDCYGISLVIQSDGKIVLGGSIDNGPLRSFGLARFNGNGSIDSTFDADGIVFTPVGTDYDQINSVLLQPDGKIIGAGFITGSVPTDIDFALARYNTDGSLDTTFDNDGIVTTIWGNEGDQCNAAALQTDGKIVAAGKYGNPSTIYNDFALARYNGDQGVGVNELKNSGNSLVIYPNPVTNELFIVGTESHGEIFVYNAEGALLLKKKSAADRTRIDTEKFIPGMYYISYRDGNRTMSLKMVK
jgi:uncharacterized delta-60 repeat protein